MILDVDMKSFSLNFYPTATRLLLYAIVYLVRLCKSHLCNLSVLIQGTVSATFSPRRSENKGTVQGYSYIG